ncbi:MAG: tRNA dimethylallyltransferase [Nitrosospira multiformis]|nr:tRNA dimethylallyltransferase [Nitrosospira multiformis]
MRDDEDALNMHTNLIAVTPARLHPGRVAVLAAVAIATLTLAGCISATPRLDAQSGIAVNIARTQQIANPNASRDNAPVEGIDGQAGDAAVDSYRESFVNPRPALSGGVVNVGSGRAGSGGGGGGMFGR